MTREYISVDMRLHNAARMLEVVLGMFENLSDMNNASFDKFQCAVSLIDSARVELDRTSDEFLNAAANELLKAAVDG